MKNTNIQKRINDLRARLEPILRQYPVEKAGLFGSVLRDDYKENSDIDLLIELEADHGMGLEYVAMILALQDAVGRKVDLVQYKGVKDVLKEYILPYEERIYEKNS